MSDHLEEDRATPEERQAAALERIADCADTLVNALARIGRIVVTRKPQTRDELLRVVLADLTKEFNDITEEF